MKVFKNIRKNNDTSEILSSFDWHKKSTLHCNGFNSFARTTIFEFSFFQHSIPILLVFFSAKSANSTVFRIPILLVTEIFLCEAYRFQKTSQTSDAQKNTPRIAKRSLATGRSLFFAFASIVLEMRYSCSYVMSEVPCFFKILIE